MSAFMVSKGHIDRLVALALFGPSDRGPQYAGDGWSRLSWWDRDIAGVARARREERQTIGKVGELCGDSEDEIRAEIGRTLAPFYVRSRRQIEHDTADRVGLMLIAANVQSIHERYPDTVDNGDDIPGDASSVVPYVFPVTTERITALEGLVAISCYEYQACEFEGWHESEAQSFCDALRKALVSALTRDTARGWDNWDRT